VSPLVKAMKRISSLVIAICTGIAALESIWSPISQNVKFSPR